MLTVIVPPLDEKEEAEYEVLNFAVQIVLVVKKRRGSNVLADYYGVLVWESRPSNAAYPMTNVFSDVAATLSHGNK